MRSLLLVSTLLMPTLVFADDWIPPDDPDPQAIMAEAKADAQAGRYEIAMAKQLWYHNNALKLQPSLSGVRLSFALSNWLKLGEEYPPALSKMREVRDEVNARIRDKEQVRVKFRDFHDFVALNRTLRDEQRTVDTFKWLEAARTEDAARVFHVAQPSLIQLKQYELCGKYIQPDRDITRIGKDYQRGLKLARDRFGKPHQVYAEKRFLNASATLVALLVQTDRNAKAKEAVKVFKGFVEDPSLKSRLDKQLEAALKGTVPNPWP